MAGCRGGARDPVATSAWNEGRLRVDLLAPLAEQAYLNAPLLDAADDVGWSVGVSWAGDTLIAGAPSDDSSSADPWTNAAQDSGAAHIFRGSSGSWGDHTYRKSSRIVAADEFGAHLSICADGATAAIGGGLGNRDHHVLSTFTLAGTAWAEQSTLVEAPHPDYGDGLCPVALSADAQVLIVGAAGEDSGATDLGGDQLDNSAMSSGAVYLFRDVGISHFHFDEYLKASNTGANDLLRWKVAVSGTGTTVAVAAIGEASSSPGIIGDQSDDAMADAGAVYVYSFR